MDEPIGRREETSGLSEMSLPPCRTNEGAAGMKKGSHHTAEARAKISANSAHLRGEDHPMYGKSLSSEVRAKISASLTGKKHTEAWCENMRGDGNPMRCPEIAAKCAAANRGKPKSPEHRAKLSAVRSGKPHPCGPAISRIMASDANPMKRPEIAAKISKLKTGVKRSLETREKISKAKRGKKMSAEFCARHTGEHCGGWRGGISFEPYCPKFNQEFKKRVRAYFNDECVLCGKSKQENGKSMHVHHVDYDKQACCDDRTPRFVVLCSRHHSMTNHNRAQWQEIFAYIIDNFFNGKTYYTLEEYIHICEDDVGEGST